MRSAQSPGSRALVAMWHHNCRPGRQGRRKCRRRKDRSSAMTAPRSDRRRSDTEPFIDVQDRVQRAAMLDHHAFWLAGRAGGENHVGKIVLARSERWQGLRRFALPVRGSCHSTARQCKLGRPFQSIRATQGCVRTISTRLGATETSVALRADPGRSADRRPRLENRDRPHHLLPALFHDSATRRFGPAPRSRRRCASRRACRYTSS